MAATEQPNRGKGGRASAQPNHGAVSAAEVEKYLKGMDFPCDKDDLIEQALGNDAPQEVLELMREFPDQEYRSVTDVARGIGQTRH